MVYDRGGYYNRSEEQDFGRDYGSGRDHSFSSAREYAAAGELGGGRGAQGRGGYGRERMGRGGYDDDRRFDERSSGYYQGGGEPYRGSYAHDGRRFAEQGQDHDRDYGRERGRGFMGDMGGGMGAGGFSRDRNHDRSYAGRGGRDDDRGFLSRAGDEVRSWFGDDDAERRRSMDDQRNAHHIRGDWGGDRVHDHRDRHYHEWRQDQISQLDRDYDEYRREHQSRFDNEFSSWRTTRQGQRQMVRQVQEHAEVFGSDGERVGTVDKVQGDRIKLTRNDPEAGGHHHSIPCGWIQSVEGNRVTLNKSSIEAKTMWRDEEYQNEGRSMFGGGAENGGREHNRSDEGGVQARDNQGRILNRSFSGTYDEK